MSEEKLLTVREVSIYLSISEKQVLDLAEAGHIPAYKVGGVFVRFKKDQVEAFRKGSKHHQPKASIAESYSVDDKVSDFFYFNDFYILAGILIILLLAVIVKG